jgi:putative transposase
VKLARLHLYNRGLFCGAQAIDWELEEWGVRPRPSLRTINRILSREELTHRRTGRYESKERKYPKLDAQSANDVHQMDYVGPCYLQGPIRFYSLNSVDLATGRWALSPVLTRPGSTRWTRSGRVGAGWGFPQIFKWTTSWSFMAADNIREAWAS